MGSSGTHDMRGKPSLFPALVLLAGPHKLVLERYREWLRAEAKGSFLIGYSVRLLWFPGNLTLQSYHDVGNIRTCQPALGQQGAVYWLHEHALEGMTSCAE